MVTQSSKEKFIIDCRYSKRLIDKLLSINRKSKIKVDFNKIKKAIYFAKEYHDKQKRGTGEPYYFHPLEVAYIVADYVFRTDVIITAILHDCIEDTILTKEIIAQEFGNKVAGQVEDLTRIKQNSKISSAEIVKILYQQNKKDLLLVKLCDRLHNMQTIKAKSPEKVWKTTFETLQIFLALAAYLKMPKIAQQLEQHCWNVISSYKMLQNKLLLQECNDLRY
ncbi:MAG: HD domain-containing protein [Rickettsia endosymbiont of Haemaphysalis japonica]